MVLVVVGLGHAQLGQALGRVLNFHGGRWRGGPLLVVGRRRLLPAKRVTVERLGLGCRGAVRGLVEVWARVAVVLTRSAGAAICKLHLRGCLGIRRRLAQLWTWLEADDFRKLAGGVGPGQNLGGSRG